MIKQITFVFDQHIEQSRIQSSDTIIFTKSSCLASWHQGCQRLLACSSDFAATTIIWPEEIGTNQHAEGKPELRPAL
jgi:hypothetical protein